MDGNGDGAAVVDMGAYEYFADCNTNAVPDSVDIAESTSRDCNANGRPDECEITAGTATDCNSNGALDSCDIAADTSPDCNGNGQPDECEVPPLGPEANDLDLNGMLDSCETVNVLNVTTGVAYPTIPAAITAAINGQEMLGTSLAFTQAPSINFGNKALLLRSDDLITQPVGGTIDLTNSAALATAPGKRLTIRGLLRSLSNAVAQVDAGEVLLESGATLRARLGSNLDMAAPGGFTLKGNTAIEANATLSVSGAVTNSGNMTIMSKGILSALDLFTNHGQFTATSGASVYLGPASTSAAMNLPGVTFLADVLTVTASGQVTGYGEFYSDLSNSGNLVITGTTTWVGDITNEPDGSIYLQIGTTTLVGNLTNNGAIVGQFSGSEGALDVVASLSVGPAASLRMPGPWRLSVTGDYDLAIASSQNYDMSQAMLQMRGAVHPQALEAMSRDVGRDPTGLDRTKAGHFPIMVLHIGPGDTIVHVADLHDNDGQGQASAEAVYVDTLQADSGARLVNPACRVYYRTLINNGTLANPANVIPLCSDGDADRDGVCDGQDQCANTIPGANVDANGCPAVISGDFDRDGDVSLDDLNTFQSCYSGPAVPHTGDCGKANFDGDNDVDQIDFGVFQRCFSGAGIPADSGCGR